MSKIIDNCYICNLLLWWVFIGKSAGGGVRRLEVGGGGMGGVVGDGWVPWDMWVAALFR